ncbi:MAG: phage tail tape measure protein [Mucilaginibacter sp.]|uniref:phage tail tape measure protein n=1 Tax=Mucilaginibacter sp. TaxID=1882438 RepID=UPI003267C9FF
MAGNLNFKTKVDISESKARLLELKKLINDVGGVSMAGPGKGLDTKPITQYQQAQLALKQTMVDAQAVSETLRQKNLALEASFKEGKITAQELAVAERQIKKDRQELAEATKAARAAQVAASGSYDEANQKLKELGRSIKAAQGGFESTNPAIKAQIVEYNKLNQGLKDFDDTMGNHQRHVGGYREALNGVGSDLKSLALNYISVYAALAAVTHVIKTNAEISDSLADVRRTASLTEVEVNALAETLKKIDTRTSLKGLLDIAIIGGQLGIAKDQLGGFTKAIDQLSVTLAGEISGGAEAVASSLGKINGVFKVQQKEGTDVERSFNKTGSAILALGQAGLATGEFLQDFGLRTAGVANISKISLPVILAYGATLEETGASAEVAGTAMSKLIGNLASKRDNFFTIAKIADSTLTLKSFTNLINTDANAALQKFFAGLNAGGKDLTSFTDLIDKIGLKGGPAKNAIIALAQNQGLLNERIGESKTAYDAGTLAAQQFAIKNDNLAASISKLSNEFDKDVQGDGIGKFFKQIVDGARNALDAIDKIFKSRSFSELSARLFTFDASHFDKINSITDNYNESKVVKKDYNPIGASSDIMISVLADKPLADLEKLRRSYIEAAKQALVAVNTYRKGIEDGSLRDGGKISLADTEKNLDALRKMVRESSAAYDKVKANTKASTKTIAADLTEIADSELKTVKEINARILELKNDALAIPANKDNDVKRVQALKATLRQLAGEAAKNDPSIALSESLLASQTTVQEKIDAVKTKYASKAKTRDEQQADEIKANFKVANDAIDAQNKKLADALKDKKITHAQARAKGLVPQANLTQSDLDNAEAILSGTQAVEKLKGQIDQQKAIYAEYESYKLKAGTVAADELYSKEIGSAKSYVEYLKSLQPTFDQLNSPDLKVKATASATQDLLDKEVAKANTEALVQQKKHLSDLILQYQDYDQKRATLIINADADIAILQKAGNKQGADQVRKDLADRLTVIDEGHIKELDAYKELFDNIDELSTDAAKKLIAELRNSANESFMLGTVTNEAYRDIIKNLDATSDKVNNKIPFGLKEIGSAFKSLSSDVSSFDSGLGKALNTIGDVVSGVGSIKEGLNTINSSKSSGFDKITSGLGIIGTGLSLVTSVFKLFDHSEQAAAKAQAQQQYNSQLQIKANDAITKQLTEQLAIIKDIYGTSRITSYGKSLSDINKAEADQQAKLSGKFTLTGNKQLDDFIAKINNGGTRGTLELGLQTIFDLLKQNGGTVDLATQSLAQLQILLLNGKIDDGTASIVQSLIDLKKQYQDTLNSLNAESVGTSFDSLLDNIVSMFGNINTNARDWADNFTNIIQGAISKSFQRQYLETQLQDFYNELAADVKANGGGALTASQIKALKDQYDRDIANAKAGITSIEQITGQKFGTPGSSGQPTTAAAQISASITEPTASRWLGVATGTQLATVQVKDLMVIQNNTLGDLYQNAISGLIQLGKIEANTRRTADNTDDVKLYLKQISTNTSGSYGLDLRAAGKFGY